MKPEGISGQSISDTQYGDVGDMHREGRSTGEGYCRRRSNRELVTAVCKEIVKGISIATLATVLIPLVLYALVCGTRGNFCYDYIQGFMVHKGALIGSILLLFNCIIVFFSISVPSVVGCRDTTR